MELATLELSQCFIHIRLLKPIGRIPTAEVDANY